MNKKEINKINWIFYILIFVLIFSIAFVIRGYFNTHYIYTGPSGDFKFDVINVANVKVNLVHVFIISGGKELDYRLTFRNNPNNLEDIDVDISADLQETIIKNNVYLTQDPGLPNLTNGESTIAMIELGRITGTAYYSIYKIPTINAITKKSERGGELGIPIVSCKNVTKIISVVEFRSGEDTKVYEENGCIIVQGKDGTELIRAADRLTFTLLGVMEKYY